MTHNIAEALQALAVEIDTLVCIEGNPRHGDVEAIAKSLTQFGQRRPLVFRSGTREVEAGNHTLLAARSLGWTHVAAFAEDDDEITAKAFALADNRTHELGKNHDAEIDAWLAEIADADLALVEAAGYDIDAVLADLPDDDFVPFEDDPASPSAAARPSSKSAPSPPSDAYEQFANDEGRAHGPAFKPPDEKEGWMVLRIGDLRAKITRDAYEGLLGQLMRQAEGSTTQAGVALARMLPIDEADIEVVRRD